MDGNLTQNLEMYFPILGKVKQRGLFQLFLSLFNLPLCFFNPLVQSFSDGFAR